MEFRALQAKDIPSIWQINEDGRPGTGGATEAEIANLLLLAEFAIGAFNKNELLGFVICMLPGIKYTSPNYAWFNEKYKDFLYVDRIAVAQNHRGRQIGSQLYEKVFDVAEEKTVVAEVNLSPPNPGSMRFHGRHGFKKVGELHHSKDKIVNMMLRNK